MQIGEGETKVVLNKVLITYFKNRIIIKSVGEAGCYRYLYDY